MVPRLFSGYWLTYMQKKPKTPAARAAACARRAAKRRLKRAAAAAAAKQAPPPPPPPPPPSPPSAPPTPQRPAPGARRLVPCAYCVDALLASSSAALCVDNAASGRRSKRCFRCASGHSCRPLYVVLIECVTCRLIARSPEVLEPLGIELVEELVRSNGTTTAVC